MNEPSKIYRHDNVRGERVIIELSMDDARAVFADCKRDQSPVDYLLWNTAERRRLEQCVRRAGWSAVLFVLVLFFFRRFIP